MGRSGAQSSACDTWVMVAAGSDSPGATARATRGTGYCTDATVHGCGPDLVLISDHLRRRRTCRPAGGRRAHVHADVAYHFARSSYYVTQPTHTKLATVLRFPFGRRVPPLVPPPRLALLHLQLSLLRLPLLLEHIGECRLGDRGSSLCLLAHDRLVNCHAARRMSGAVAPSWGGCGRRTIRVADVTLEHEELRSRGARMSAERARRGVCARTSIAAPTAAPPTTSIAARLADRPSQDRANASISREFTRGTFAPAAAAGTSRVQRGRAGAWHASHGQPTYVHMRSAERHAGRIAADMRADP